MFKLQHCGILLFLVTSGCRGADGDAFPSEKASVDAQVGWTGEQPWRLVEETRIGATEGTGADVFGNIVDVELDVLGRVWVADGQHQEIRVFDERGSLVRIIGRKGSGPEEFRAIAGMEWSPDGNLWVMDGGNGRFSIYDTEGTLVDTRPRKSVLTTSPWPGRFDREGRLYDVEGGLSTDGSITTSIVRFAALGDGRDTFQVPPFSQEWFETRRGTARNQVVNRINVPFAGMQFWALDPEGYVWIANTAHYRLERHAFEGGVQNVVQRDIPRVAVTRQERERRLEDYREFIRQGGKIDLSRIPDSYPALHGFLFDDEGHLWVSPITRADEGRVLDVFRLNGRYLGRVALPTALRSSPRAIRNNRMLVIARDSLDVPTVHVLHIRKPGS